MTQSRFQALLLIGLSGLNSFVFATEYKSNYSFCSADFQKKTDKDISKIYKKTPTNITNISERITYFNRWFLNKPYTLTALGEGLKGDYDQAPLYRTDTFDCQTYVETILALSLSESLPQFKQCIQHVRYSEGKNNYIRRLHFTSPDWNQHNQTQGILKDITSDFLDTNQKPVALYAKAIINAPQWYQHFTLSQIRLCNTSQQTAQKKLEILKKQAKRLPIKTATLPYLPLTSLIKADGQANTFLFDQIPNGAIIEIVRPNWDLTERIGTHLNVSHLGFAIREQGDIYFYQASKNEGKIFKSTLLAYLKSIQSEPTIQGINIQMILPAKLCRN